MTRLDRGTSPVRIPGNTTEREGDAPPCTTPARSGPDSARTSWTATSLACRPDTSPTQPRGRSPARTPSASRRRDHDPGTANTAADHSRIAIDHVGITVPDLERAVRFFVDVFGFQVTF
ncbi:hypothetical protein HP467_03590 [Curtobacterium albidum]|uniref:VOC domain-containing protein n=1 Tax=Curtobacterium citreum TaxID=2036 RepID=A0A850DSS1_9MICO|nr:hypothetical protein [Curtobacterium albidum]